MLKLFVYKMKSFHKNVIVYFLGGDIMIITKKHIMIAIIFCIAVTAIVVCVKKHESRQVFAGDGIKIVLDAGHGAYV